MQLIKGDPGNPIGIDEDPTNQKQSRPKSVISFEIHAFNVTPPSDIIRKCVVTLGDIQKLIQSV